MRIDCNLTENDAGRRFANLRNYDEVLVECLWKFFFSACDAKILISLAGCLMTIRNSSEKESKPSVQQIYTEPVFFKI